MIVSFIFSLLVDMLTNLFFWLPQLTFPAIFVTAMLWVTDLITSTLGVLQLLFGNELLAAMVVVSVFKITFDPIWYATNWLL